MIRLDMPMRFRSRGVHLDLWARPAHNPTRIAISSTCRWPTFASQHWRWALTFASTAENSMKCDEIVFLCRHDTIVEASLARKITVHVIQVAR